MSNELFQFILAIGSILFLIVFIQIFYIFVPFNQDKIISLKYKIYKCNNKKFYAKVYRTRLLGIFPYYTKLKVYSACGFEDYNTNIHYFKSKKYCIHYIESEYERYLKNKKNHKPKRIL